MDGDRTQYRGRRRAGQRIGGGRLDSPRPSNPPDFSRLQFTINGSTFRYGAFINAVIAFALIAAALFFFLIKPLTALMARAEAKAEEPAPATRKCPECLSDIPVEAMRCAFCGEPVPVTTEG